ncbi:uncharacterized protein CCR75_004824 [Bremia lactucae]|uniref:Uncharacterized protein n=1 Tax=Bremia lactucae TaxID=4779 RepID=A0A976IDL3_BRELC|nr:hypothetical protein CCR75_004824 [Bremia lactucae]
MTDRLVHNRAFRVSKERNQLVHIHLLTSHKTLLHLRDVILLYEFQDLLCEQRRRQLSHRKDLPDQERLATPAGKANNHHERTPAFFAWNEEAAFSRSRPTWQAETPQKIARTLHLTPPRECQPAPERSPDGSRYDERALFLHENEDICTVQDHDIVTSDPVERVITVTPIREDILDRVRPSGSTFRSHDSPSHAPLSTPRPLTPHSAAGLPTIQADRYRMNRSSGKRIRVSAQPTSLWNTTGTPQDNTQKRLYSANPSLRRSTDSSAVSQALQMTTTDSNSAGHDTITTFRDVPIYETRTDTRHVSFSEKKAHPQPRTLPVLADKTTQTDESLGLPRSDARLLSPHILTEDEDKLMPCAVHASNTDEAERSRKKQKTSDAAEQPQFRRTSSHTTNPILINPRILPDTTTFRRRSTNSSVLNDRLAWR